MANEKNEKNNREGKYMWGEGDVKVLTPKQIEELEKKEAERRNAQKG